MGCTDCTYSTLLHFLKQEAALTERDTSLAHVHCTAMSERERKGESNTAFPPLNTFKKVGRYPFATVFRDAFDSYIGK